MRRPRRPRRLQTPWAAPANQQTHRSDDVIYGHVGVAADDAADDDAAADEPRDADDDTVDTEDDDEVNAVYEEGDEVDADD